MQTLRVVLAALCFLSSFIAQSAHAQQVLFVVGDRSLSSADTTIKKDLEAIGMQVKVVKDVASATSDADGRDLVLISHSVFSARVGSKFSRVSIPVVAYEPYVYDDLGMSSNSGQSNGIAYSRRRNILMQGSHPLTGGFSGLVQISNRGAFLAWAEPGDDAIVAATLRANRQRATIFGYEAGATLANGQTAPAKRVGLFPHIGSIDRRTSASREIFLNAVQWALSEPEEELLLAPSEPEDTGSGPVAESPAQPVNEPVIDNPVVTEAPLDPETTELPESPEPTNALNVAPAITDTSYQCDPVAEVVVFNTGETDFFTLSVDDESPLTLKYESDSSNEAVASVSVDGNGTFQVTALSRGESFLWLTAEDESGLADEFELRVIVE